MVKSAPPISACGSNSDGGDAISGTVVYVPCANGVQAIQTEPSGGAVANHVIWVHGPPITAGGLVWSIGGSSLYGLNPTNGAKVQQVSVGGEANHFLTPSVGDGLLLAPVDQSGERFLGLGRSARAAFRHRRRRRRRPTRRTGWSPPMGGSSLSATTGLPRLHRQPDVEQAGGGRWRRRHPRNGYSLGGLRWGDLQLRRRRLPSALWAASR